MCLRCPFYGFRWPDRSTTLRYVGGIECGLDFDRHSSCVMKMEGRSVSHFSCPVVRAKWNFLQAGKHLMHFDFGNNRSESLAEWEQSRKQELSL